MVPNLLCCIRAYLRLHLCYYDMILEVKIVDLLSFWYVNVNEGITKNCSRIRDVCFNMMFASI